MHESLKVDSSLRTSRWGLAAIWVSFSALSAGIVLLAINNLGNRYFWTDESSSLYTALGWPAVGERAGTLADAWIWITGPNLEPGLHNVLERFWALGMGTDIVTLRVYPFLFFMMYLGAVIALGRLVCIPWILIAGVLGLVLMENITPYNSVELRPTSAGLAASVVVPLLVLLILKQPHLWTLLLFGAGLLFIGSMQYNSYPIEAAAGFLLILLGWSQYRGRQRSILIGAGLIAVMWLPLLYLVTRGNPLGAVRTPGFGNISQSLIPNMERSEVLSLLQQNLLSWTALPRTVFLVLVPVLWFTRRWPWSWSRSQQRVQFVNVLWGFVLLATLASAGVGFLGLMPWILGTRWSIAEVGLIAVSLIGTAGIFVQVGLLQHKSIAALAALASVAICFMAGYRLAAYERFPGYNWKPVLATLLDGETGRSVIDTEIYTDLRYWVELSGDYDEFRSAWIQHGIKTTSNFSKADASSLKDFLVSNNDRLLLGDASILETAGLPLPSDVEVVYAPAWDESTGFIPPQPVLLIRDG